MTHATLRSANQAIGWVQLKRSMAAWIEIKSPGAQLGLRLVIPASSRMNNQVNRSFRLIILAHAGLVGRRTTNAKEWRVGRYTPETTLAAAETRILSRCKRCGRAVRVADI